MHTVFALLCFVVVIHWLIFPYPSGLLHWHCGNLTIDPVPAKQPWWIWINTSCQFITNDCITTTKQSTTKPCAYILGYTVFSDDLLALDPRADASYPETSGFAFSPWFTSFEGDCLEVAFYTFGASRNTFGIFLQDESTQLHPLYNTTPAYDKTWYTVQLYLPKGHWRIMIAGFRSNTWGDLIVVDYIKVANDVCPRPCKSSCEQKKPVLDYHLLPV